MWIFRILGALVLIGYFTSNVLAACSQTELSPVVTNTINPLTVGLPRNDPNRKRLGALPRLCIWRAINFALPLGCGVRGIRLNGTRQGLNNSGVTVVRVSDNSMTTMNVPNGAPWQAQATNTLWCNSGTKNQACRDSVYEIQSNEILPPIVCIQILRATLLLYDGGY